VARVGMCVGVLLPWGGGELREGAAVFAPGVWGTRGIFWVLARVVSVAVSVIGDQRAAPVRRAGLSAGSVVPAGPRRSFRGERGLAPRRLVLRTGRTLQGRSAAGRAGNTGRHRARSQRRDPGGRSGCGRRRAPPNGPCDSRR